MARLSVGDAARAVGGRVTAGDPDAMIEGAAIDSRAVRGGEAFFAFGGAHTDGHRFVPDALARGAAAAIIQEDVPASPAGALIRVEDTFQALHDLARFVRTRTPERLAGITGSAGKTTTKELLGAILASRFRTAWTPGNLNNLYGFPLSLLNVPDGTAVDGGRDGDVDAGRAAPALAARPAGRRRLHRRAPRPPGVLRHHPGDRRGEVGAPGGARRRAASSSPTPTTPR